MVGKIFVVSVSKLISAYKTSHCIPPSFLLIISRFIMLIVTCRLCLLTMLGLSLPFS